MNKLILSCASLLLALGFTMQALSVPLSLANKPLFTGNDVAPMMMLVMGRDHTLYYEAYNDASDLDGDGVLDIKFKPAISYEGYFDSAKCYSYKRVNGKDLFYPERVAATCTTAGQWSGNFLNYLTMTRMDLLRKILYGGYRIKDDDNTVLQRAFVPQDAHSWAKSYTSEAVDGYDIADYTPYTTSDSTLFFGTATFDRADNLPSLRVIKTAQSHVTDNGSDWGVWSWASSERTVLSKNASDYYDNEYILQVSVCNNDLLESNCKKYNGNGNGAHYKPTGLLHQYGEDDQMLFGLLTGSYNGNLSGGVLRKAISQFSDEVNTVNGHFTNNSNGIVATINKLSIYGYRYSDHTYQPNCGWVTSRAINEGECASWGNPIGEMLYESLRYFAGTQTPSTSYDKAGAYDESLDLTTATWDDPFTGNGRAYCSRANNLLISDINPSYDSDQLPGAYSEFSSTYQGSTLADFNITDLLTTISTGENITSGDYFIGQSASNSDGAPTAKAIAGLGSIRGLAPAEPTKQGSYSSAGVAYYGKTHDLRSDLQTAQNVKTTVVSLASPLPEVKVKVGESSIKIIPFAKSVGNTGTAYTSFYPTNTIVDWYVQSQSETAGVFRINFEDVEQGADHDMDMIVKYSYQVEICYPVNDPENCSAEGTQRLAITLDSIYAAGGTTQHAGYVISGTTNDDLYLEVEDRLDSNESHIINSLDTPDSTDYRNRGESGSEANLPLTATRYFYPSRNQAANFLNSPLWYAAKWGGFTETGSDNKPTTTDEWDADGDGLPDAYFPVTNAGELKSQLGKAFNSAFVGDLLTTPTVYNSNILKQGIYAYQSSFEEQYWSGDIKAFKANSNKVFRSTPQWSAAAKLDSRDWTTRKIFTRNNESGEVFKFKANKVQYDDVIGDDAKFSATQLADLLGDVSGSTAEKRSYIKALINYLSGERSHEAENTTYDMRKRNSVLGDVINSTPYYVAASKGHAVVKDLLVFAANDGMVHLLNANTGKELMAYIPSGIYSKLNDLADTNYIHQYSVDGGISAYTQAATEDNSAVTTLVGGLGIGGQGLYAIDVSDMTTPSADMMKWEITTETADYSGLGYTTAAPTIAKLAVKDIDGNNRVGVIFANGYNSSDPASTIYIADLSDGSLIAKLSSGTVLTDDPSGAQRPNAMASPLVVDTNADGVADRIYAGDLYGNMWAFDIANESVSEWGNAINDNNPLFSAKSPTKKADGITYLSQPITTRPSIAAHLTGLKNGVLLAFGTGKYIESADNSAEDQATQSFYVIWDKLTGAAVSSDRSLTNSDKYNSLLSQSILMEDTSNRLLSQSQVDWRSHLGFYLDLVNTEDGNSNNYGERQVTNSFLVGNKIAFTTMLPNSDPCSAGGTGWYMELNLHTGHTWNKGSGDTKNEDGEIIDIADDSSNQKVEGIPTGITGLIVVKEKPDITDEDGNTTDEEGNPLGESANQPSVDLRNCIRTTSGSNVCFDGPAPTTGRLTWQQLY